MTLELDPQLMGQLEILAQQQGRDLNSLLQEAVTLYLSQQGAVHQISPELIAAQQRRLEALRGPH